MWRWLPLLGVALAATYPLSWGMGLAQPVTIAWKGAGVALLALWALRNARATDGYLLALVMALGALGDILLEVAFAAGALSFMAGHAVAIWLYLRNRRAARSMSQTALGLLLIPATLLIAFLLPADRTQAPGVALYALFLAAMAATAWTSSFPRYRVGLGAILFLASDLLIFARMGPMAGSIVPTVGIWPLYYLGQLLICTGVLATLRADGRAR